MVITAPLYAFPDEDRVDRPRAFHSFPYLNAKRGGGTMMVSCPLFRATVDRLPRDIDALVMTSDLQGIAGGRLLGEGLVAELSRLADAETIPSLDRGGAVLAGDLFSAPEADAAARRATSPTFDGRSRSASRSSSASPATTT